MATAFVPSLPQRIRRLSQREYLNVVEDLLGNALAKAAARMIPSEPVVAGFDNQDSMLRVSSLMFGSFAGVAAQLSSKANVAMLAPCGAGQIEGECVQQFAEVFSRRAFGRAPTQAELTSLLATAATGDGYDESIRLIVEQVLQSPGILYATELGPENQATGSSVRLTDNEVANLLSLLVTATRADAALQWAAEDGLLRTPDQLANQADRLMQTPLGQKQLLAFVSGWADMQGVEQSPKSAEVFPTYTPDLAQAMQQEFNQFVQSHVADGTLTTLMTDTSRNVPSTLAPIYGTELTITPDATVLDPTRRRGIFSLPAWLTYHSADQHSGPVERGLFVRRQLFCQDVPGPPQSLAAQISLKPIDPKNKELTTRQKYESHTTTAVCAGCHQQFDPIGFGFEEMDGIGRLRTTENDLPVDSSGTLTGTDVDGPFNGVAELSAKLAKSNLFRQCFVQHFFRFATARETKDEDAFLLGRIDHEFVQQEGRITSLVKAFVKDPMFVIRRTAL